MKNRGRRTLRFVLLAILVGLGGQISSWAAPPIEAYGRLPGVEFMRLSPSGERYAFVALIGDSRKLTVVTADGKVLYWEGLGTAKVRRIDWAGDDHLLLTTTATVDMTLDFGNIFELSWVLNIGIKDKTRFAIFNNAGSIANIVFGYFGTARVDGHRYGYFAGMTYRRSFGGDYVFERDQRDLYQVDLDTAQTKLITRNSSQHDHWVMSPNGTVIAHSEYEQSSGAWRLYRGAGRGSSLVLEITAPLHNVGLAGQGRTPGTVLVVNYAGDEDVVEEVSITEGKKEVLFDNAIVEEYLHDPDTGLLIGALTKGEPQAVFFDKKLLARINGMRKAFPGLGIELASFSRNLDRMIVKTAGSDDSGTYWLVDIASGHADPIGYARPGIRSVDVGPTKRVNYTAADGLKIEGVLTLPPGRRAEKLPLVVLPHDGPTGMADTIGFDWWAQAYASAGYAVLKPNYRGSGNYGREFRQAGFGQWGRKMQTDLSDGVAAMAAQGLIDPKRVCIVGAGYGGYAALAGVTLQHGLYRCAVSVGGLADMSSFFAWQLFRHGDREDGRYNNSPTRYWLAVTGADKDSTAMRNISPINFVAQADAPILLIHGKDDTMVPIEQSEEMASALKSAGKPVEFITLKGEDHWLSREETRVSMLRAAVDFVKKYNPPD